MVVPVHEGDPHVGAREGAGRIQTRKSATDDDHMLLNFAL